MALNRTAIYRALARRLDGLDGVQSVRRRFVSFANLADAQCPALLVLPGNETAEHRQRGLPPIWTLRAAIVVVARAPVADEAPDEVLLPILDAIEDRLARDPSEPAGLDGSPDESTPTFGGLVRSTSIDAVEYSPAEGEHVVATVTLSMLINAPR